MSDCSTNAMKPKEPLKTCGNCGHFLIGDCVADEYRNTHLYFETDCNDWFSLEQRYQQLEQVAKDLYNAAWCAWFLKINEEMPELDKELKESVADSYLQNERYLLEALGVRLDD